MGSAMSLADAHARGPAAGRTARGRGAGGRAVHAPPPADSACASGGGAAERPQRRTEPEPEQQKNKDSAPSAAAIAQTPQDTMNRPRTKTKTIAPTTTKEVKTKAAAVAQVNNTDINTALQTQHSHAIIFKLDHQTTTRSVGQLLALEHPSGEPPATQAQMSLILEKRGPRRQKSNCSANRRADRQQVASGQVENEHLLWAGMCHRDHRSLSLSTSSSLGSSAGSSSSTSSGSWRGSVEARCLIAAPADDNNNRQQKQTQRRRHSIQSNKLLSQCHLPSLQSTSSSSSSSASSVISSSCSPKSPSSPTPLSTGLSHLTLDAPICHQQRQQQQQQLQQQLIQLEQQQSLHINLPRSPDPSLLLFYRQQHQYLQQQQRELDRFADLSASPPPPRQWIWAQPRAAPQPRYERHLDFTVVSYNVLCDRMANLQMFPDTPELALDWLYRREMILKQLLDFEADVVALQELEVEEYESYFRPELAELGLYESVFEPKSRARTMDPHRRRRVDGCAIFFRRNKFRLVQRHLLEFNQIAMANARGSEAMLNRVMTKDNIGLAAVLEFIEPQQVVHPQQRRNRRCNKLQPTRSRQQPSTQPKRILVCNTHIHWDPECCDVKLVQTIMLMNELNCIARHHAASQQQVDPSLPLVLLGDFNSTPNSGVAEYLTEGRIDSLHKDFKSFKYTTCENALSIPSSSFAASKLSSNHSPLRPTASSNELLADQPPMNQRRRSTPAYSLYSHPMSIAGSNAPNKLQETRLGAAHYNGLGPEPATEEQTILNYSHPFKLASAYEGDAMPYTNYTTKFKAIIDYIFFSQDSLDLIGILGPLDKAWVKGNRYRGFPQPHLPSDHLPLLAKLRWSAPSLAQTSPRQQYPMSSNQKPANRRQQLTSLIKHNCS